MPDLTLYASDVVLIRDMINEFRISTKRRFELYETIPPNLARLYEEGERINDKLMDRLTQKLHPLSTSRTGVVVYDEADYNTT